MSKGLNELAQSVHKTAKEHGWFETDRTFGDDCALIHSEVSEALEAFRELDLDLVSVIGWSQTSFDHKGKPLGIGSELADIIIRVLDTSVRYGIDIEEMVHLKMVYNDSRPYRHGGKRL